MSFLYARFGKAVIAGEVAVLGGTYYIYHQLTTSEEYRRKMERHMPWFMDVFHQATKDSYRLDTSAGDGRGSSSNHQSPPPPPST
jgi:hypothetical protein